MLPLIGRTSANCSAQVVVVPVEGRGGSDLGVAGQILLGADDGHVGDVSSPGPLGLHSGNIDFGCGGGGGGHLYAAFGCQYRRPAASCLQ